jgi:dephospho-CoA kinase
MILVGLTGGIGSGKSTVSAMLASRGAIVVDADVITRQVQQRGSPVVQAIVDRFGPGTVDLDGNLKRAKLAEIVFADPAALADLNAIVHPAVGKEIDRLVREFATTDKIVVLDIPLLTERPRPGIQGKIVVDVPVDVQIARLVAFRGFTEEDARARIARQASREDRLKDADVVIDNSGSREDLEARVEEAWQWLMSRPQLPPDFSVDRQVPQT